MNYPAAELRGIQNNLLPLDGTPSRRELHPGGGRIKVGVKILSVFPLTLTLSLCTDWGGELYGCHFLRQAQDRHPRSHPSTGSGQGTGYSDIFS